MWQNLINTFPFQNYSGNQQQKNPFVSFRSKYMLNGDLTRQQNR